MAKWDRRGKQSFLRALQKYRYIHIHRFSFIIPFGEKNPLIQFMNSCGNSLTMTIPTLMKHDFSWLGSHSLSRHEFPANEMQMTRKSDLPRN